MHSSSWPERLLTSPQVSPPVACLGSKDHRLGPWASSQASWWTKAASFLASAESFRTSAESLRTSAESFRTSPKLLRSSRCCFWVNSLSSLIRSNAFAFASELPMLNCSSRRRVVVCSAETRLGAACPHPVGGSHGSACLSGPRAVGHGLCCTGKRLASASKGLSIAIRASSASASSLFLWQRSLRFSSYICPWSFSFSSHIICRFFSACSSNVDRPFSIFTVSGVRRSIWVSVIPIAFERSGLLRQKMMTTQLSLTFFFFPNCGVQFRASLCRGCILSPCLFNVYAEYIMRNAGLEEAQAGVKIAGRNINNLRYAVHNPYGRK